MEENDVHSEESTEVKPFMALTSFEPFDEEKTSTGGCRHKRRKKNGFYRRGRDGKSIQRFLCLDCGKTFTNVTGTLMYRSKKTFVYGKLYEYLVNNSTLRRSSLSMRVSRKTVRRYLILLGISCRRDLDLDLKGRKGEVSQFQFDDMETFHHTKLKPLSITLAVEKDTRRILGFSLAQMPAKGKTAADSRKKYGPRKDHRDEGLDHLLKALTHIVIPECIITTDKCPRYPKAIKKHFPKAKHIAVKGRKAKSTGQGELKQGWDEIFSLNHTAAMFRATVSRLFRRTWNTTKKPSRLFAHLLIYAHFHNNVLLHWPSKRY